MLDQAPLRRRRTAAPRSPAGPWLQEWLDRDAALGARLDALLDDTGDLTPHARRRRGRAARCPPGGLLFVGASNPVRDLDLMVPRYDVGDRRMVVANRGLSGIDGTRVAAPSAPPSAGPARPGPSRCSATSPSSTTPPGSSSDPTSPGPT